jgi:hypothetical protein
MVSVLKSTVCFAPRLNNFVNKYHTVYNRVDVISIIAHRGLKYGHFRFKPEVAAILNFRNVKNGFRVTNNPQNHSKIVKIGQGFAEILPIEVIMVICANYANYANCSTHAS